MNTDTASVLQKHGLKITAARKAILGAFPPGCNPLSADDVLKTVGRKKMDLTTVYRNLESLETAGILVKADISKEADYYERAGGHHHHHLICTVCGFTEDFTDCDIEVLGKKVLRKSKEFNSIEDHSVTLQGQCKKCAKG